MGCGVVNEVYVGRAIVACVCVQCLVVSGFSNGMGLWRHANCVFSWAFGRAVCCFQGGDVRCLGGLFGR